MLNKPTNLHPYNEFVDVNNGINFEFTLNNVVENIELDCYSSDDKLVYDTQLSNTNGRLKFTHSLDDTSAKAFASNGNDYYWKVRYWNTPLDDNLKTTTSKAVNYWDKSKGIIGLKLETDNITSHHTASFTINTTPYTTSNHYIDVAFPITPNDATTNSFNTWEQTVNTNIADGETYYVYLTNTYYKIRTCVQIERISSYAADASKGHIYARIYPVRATFSNVNFYVDARGGGGGQICKLSEGASKNILTNDFIKIPYTDSNNNSYSCLYKICALDIGVYQDVPCFAISVGNALPINFPEYTGNEMLQASVYSSIDYNESLPAYFSCRITPEISVSVGYNTTTIRRPFVNITGTNPNKVSIGSYVYQVYRVINNKDIFCWESERQNAYGATSFTSVEYPNITPSSIYKLRLIGQTTEGMDFETESLFESSSFIDEAIDLDFVSFDKQRGCNIIDVSKFRITNTSNAEDWQPNDCFTNILRYDVLNDSLEDVSLVEYEVDITSDENGYYKVSKIYDFNIACNGEYIYYAFMYDAHNEPPWGKVYRSNLVTPTWHGVYITDLTQSEQDYDYGNGYDAYTTDLDNNWFIELNYEPDKIVRNYQINHPMGINSKYPKSIRGKANYKTGTIAGLLGHVGCSTGEYEEGYQLADKFDEFCGNGNPKLIRSHIPGKNFIVDLDTMDTSVYGYDATLVNLSYTQIDDTKLKRINIEV